MDHQAMTTGAVKQYVGGLFRTLWQDWQLRTICSMCLSIKGHQTCVRASDFIFTISGWLVCNSINTTQASGRTQELSLSFPTTNILPQQVSSWRQFAYGFSSASTLVGQPLCVYIKTFDSTGSEFVARLKLSVSTGRNAIWVRLNNR